jgi:hypothetical protein
MEYNLAQWKCVKILKSFLITLWQFAGILTRHWYCMGYNDPGIYNFGLGNKMWQPLSWSNNDMWICLPHHRAQCVALWTWWEIFSLNKMWMIPCLTEQLSASTKKICSMDLFLYLSYICRASWGCVTCGHWDPDDVLLQLIVHSLCLPPAWFKSFFNASCQFTPFLDLRSLIFCLRPFNLLLSITLSSYLRLKHYFWFTLFDWCFPIYTHFFRNATSS